MFTQDVNSVNYNPPLTLANEVESFYGNQRDLRILDAAAGTGLGGKYVSLSYHGYIDRNRFSIS